MFTDYPLHERVQSALAKKAFDIPTPIQAETLPFTLEGKDILGQARTGTGKTLAFGLPIASRLEPDKSKGRTPRALVLTPTRELALQVAKELDWLAPHLTLTSVYGGTGYHSQEVALKKGTDVVVATPGRALDYLRRGVLKLGAIEVAVLDEADEMLSMGFSDDIETLLSATPKERQTLLFSATLPKWAKKLARDYLIAPEHINVMADEEVLYEEIAIETNLKHRPGILSDLLYTHFGQKTIIFTDTKAETDELARNLSGQGHGAEAINGDLNQAQRERVMRRFRSGQISILIGTNVAARGLDIPQVDLVVHYRMPNESESYQHRSGRTGRAGRAGKVILLHGSRERRELNLLERQISRKFSRGSAPTVDSIQTAKLDSLLNNAKSQAKKDKAAWAEVAQSLIDSQDADTVAGLFAFLLGGAPKQRSLLTGEENWFTLELKGDLKNPGQVVRILKEAGANDLGRIQLSRGIAYVDLRPEEARLILECLPNVSKAQSVPVEELTRAPKGSKGKSRNRSFQRSSKGYKKGAKRSYKYKITPNELFYV